MPSNRKVYQKKTTVKEKFALMKFFFRPLYAKSLFISRLKSFSRTIGKSYSARMPVILRACFLTFRTRLLFLCSSLRRIGQRGDDPSAEARLKAGRGLRPPALHIVIICALSLSCSTDNRIGAKPRIPAASQKERERFIYYLGTERQRENCLFGTTYGASEVYPCIDCHK